jgi:hypothetical protein
MEALMRELRLVLVLLLGAAGALVASPAHAVGSQCPKVFELAPVSVLGADFTGQVDNVNHDGWICIRVLTSGSGVFVDNVVP